MRIFFSVGEPSGDLHGANLIRRLKSRDAAIECVGFGGPKMQAAGCDLHFDLTSLAVMFLASVLKNIRLFFRLIAQANHYFENHQVDAVVLIDYAGFNWWIARKAKKHGIPVFFYGVPQVWAWAPWRIRKIRKLVDHVLCKLPFEAQWFTERNCHATYVGHPYFDQLASQEYDFGLVERIAGKNNRLITLLPGSRDQEVRNILPILLDTAKFTLQEDETCRFAVAFYNERQRQMSSKLIAESKVPIEVYVGKTPELMQAAYACVACSGSVSLELLHYRKPTVIVFKVRRWVMVAQAFLLRVKFITLVNLIAAKDIRRRKFRLYNPDDPNAESCVMPEYLTAGDPSVKVARRVLGWLKDVQSHSENVAELDRLAVRYTQPGATSRAADYLLGVLCDGRSTEGGRDDGGSPPTEQAAEVAA
ncbi:lipid-A-disaccharide synthase [bacterium]|nr:lipid-A-disaccharide synthase [bacterium]MDB4380794.1 lipid-A-disaccharide synthase [Mariniblastus sp.]